MARFPIPGRAAAAIWQPQPPPDGPHELPLAAETFAWAFEADPMFRFLFPAAPTRLPWLRFTMSAMLAMSAPDGHVYTTGAAADGDVPAGVALSHPWIFDVRTRGLGCEDERLQSARMSAWGALEDAGPSAQDC